MKPKGSSNIKSTKLTLHNQPCVLKKAIASLELSAPLVGYSVEVGT